MPWNATSKAMLKITDHNKENMILREFVRFSYQHRIIPSLIEIPDDIVKLLKHAVKSSEDT